MQSLVRWSTRPSASSPPCVCPVHSRPKTLHPREDNVAAEAAVTAYIQDTGHASSRCPSPGLPTDSTDTAGPAAEAILVLVAVDAKGRCLLCREEQQAARRYRCKIIAGLVLPFALQALDVTIVASALPWIATDFGEVAQLNWIISAFNLTSATFIPFWGQAADIVGRHAAIQAAIVCMMAGSALCTAAPAHAFAVLLLGRAVQGLGCAGLNVVVRVILLDRVSLRENAKNWSFFSFIAGMSYGIGPAIGGVLTNASWRWCFAINLPISLVALLLIYVVLRPELLPPVAVTAEADRPLRRRLATVDVGGLVLFLGGLALVILALTWAGATYAWHAAPVLLALGAGLLLAAGFVVYERLMEPGRRLARRWPRQRPMLPWRLLAHKDLGLLFYVNFATGAAMYSVLYFCNLYFTMVKHYGATDAGLQLMYYTPGLGVGVYLSMWFLNAWPRKTFVPLMLGSVVEAAGVGMLGWALWTERASVTFGMMALTGAGTGLRLMPASLHAVAFFPRHIATVVSVMAVALPLGGTVALTVMSTVFNNTSGIGSTSPLRNVETLAELPVVEQEAVAQEAKTGIVWAFVAITPVMIVCIIAAAFLGNVDIAQDKGGSKGHVTHGVYLAEVLRRWRRQRTSGRSSSGSSNSMSGLEEGRTCSPQLAAASAVQEIHEIHETHETHEKRRQDVAP